MLVPVIAIKQQNFQEGLEGLVDWVKEVAGNDKGLGRTLAREREKVAEIGRVFTVVTVHALSKVEMETIKPDDEPEKIREGLELRGVFRRFGKPKRVGFCCLELRGRGNDGFVTG